MAKEGAGKGRRLKRGRIKRGADAQDQYEGIFEAQRRVRRGDHSGIIDNTEKSEQRFQNALNRVGSGFDAEDEFDE